jgi:asparagine N-glycosylation enzyme membrane subunit Stt3
MTDQVLMALYGGGASLCAMIGLVFVRYWVTARDRLFLFFAFAFWCFAVGWVLRVLTDSSEHVPYIYLARLLGFALIILAIFDKNRRSRA